MTVPEKESDIEQWKHTQHDHWNAAGAGYSKWVVEGGLAHDIYDKFAGFFVERFSGAGDIQILDVASASGEPAVSIARALPGAHVISTDLAEAYLALGQARAEHAGLADRVSFQTADGEDLCSFQDASMDAVACSLGLMFMPRHPRALAEMHRVLKPGGTLAVAVWYSISKMPFFKNIMEFCQELDPSTNILATPNTATRFGDSAAELLEAMHGAGFLVVQQQQVEATFAFPASIWWMALVEMPLPLGKTLAKLQQEQGRDGIYEEARSKLEALFCKRGYFKEDGSLAIPGNFCHFIAARK